MDISAPYVTNAVRIGTSQEAGCSYTGKRSADTNSVRIGTSQEAGCSFTAKRSANTDAVKIGISQEAGCSYTGKRSADTNSVRIGFSQEAGCSYTGKPSADTNSVRIGTSQEAGCSYTGKRSADTDPVRIGTSLETSCSYTAKRSAEELFGDIDDLDGDEIGKRSKYLLMRDDCGLKGKHLDFSSKCWKWFKIWPTLIFAYPLKHSERCIAFSEIAFTLKKICFTNTSRIPGPEPLKRAFTFHLKKKKKVEIFSSTNPKDAFTLANNKRNE